MSIEILKNQKGVLDIPEGITELSDDFALVFDWMPEIKRSYTFREIKIPSSVKKINRICLTEYDPYNVPVRRFKKILVAEDNPYYADIDGVLFSKDLTRLLCYPCGKIGQNYNVPDTVKIIEKYAFENNVNLRKIVLPNSLKRIEKYAFFMCENLSSVNLPEGLEYIGNECFACSLQINRLIIPNNIKQIATSLFSQGSIIWLQNSQIEFEFDYVMTEYLDMPYDGPAIISNGSEEIIDFAESYYYNHFENCYEDKTGIIWADNGKTLVCFPSEWSFDEYELPEKVEKVYVGAFKGTSLKRFNSNHTIIIIGRTEDEPRHYEQMSGQHFHLSNNVIFCDDNKEKNNNIIYEIIQKEINIEQKDKYVFISYSSKNQQMADSIRHLLIENEISCWMAPYDIPAGSKYAYVINDALEKCSCLLLLLTNASQMSQFVEREIERAITYNKPIIPMQLEDLKLNSGFKFYIGNSQIIAVPEIRADAPEFIRVLSGIKKFIN